LFSKSVICYFQDKKNKHVDRVRLAENVYEEVSKYASSELINLFDQGINYDFNGLVISVGGDGCFLGSTHIFRNFNNHYLLVGVKGKSLSAYAETNYKRYEFDLNKVFNNKFRVLKAFRIGAETKKESTWCCINELVVFPQEQGKMLEYELIANHEGRITSFSDGRSTSLLFSTPCGSSAYALSAGGSILHSSLNLINIVPESPNKSVVSNKRVKNSERDSENLITPYVWPGNTELILKLKYDGLIIPDGRSFDKIRVLANEEIIIKKRESANLIKLLD